MGHADPRAAARGRYIPAAGRRGLTALYDPVLAVTMRERRFRSRLVDEALASRPRTILDVGCGTGTLAINLARRAPEAEVIGLDGDPEILRRAAHKAQTAGVTLRLVHGLAGEIPLDDASIECAVSSLVFHHLAPDEKARALREIARVLSPGGRLVIADWGHPQDPVMSVGFFVLQLLDGFTSTRQHRDGEFPDVVRDAGFDVRELDRMRTAFGTLEFLRGTPRPDADPLGRRHR